MMMSLISKLKLSCLIAVPLVLSACGDEVDQSVDNLFEDMDYSDSIAWPQTQNANCPVWKAGDTITINSSLKLPQNCVYNQVTIKLAKPNIEFDCNGAVFNGIKELHRHSFGDTYTAAEAPRGTAFQVAQAEAETTRLQNISIRNCQILNYIHGFDVKYNLSANTIFGLRQGTVSEDILRTKAPADIKVFNSKIINTHGSGVYVYRYITNFQMSDTHVKGAGGPGLYLDSGTRAATIKGSFFEGNGFSSYDETTRVRAARRTDLAKREGIAIDSSGQHVIQSNSFKDNGDGGVYLYKNCWENSANANEWPRLDGANNNKIDGNYFFNETVGIWVAERADRDLADFNCGDPIVLQEGSKKFYRDYASTNILSNNRFDMMQTGIKVMDDNTVIERNTFARVENYDLDIGSRVRLAIGDAVSNTNVGTNTYSKANSIRYQYGAQ
jgi:hypothetical protein